MKKTIHTTKASKSSLFASTAILGVGLLASKLVGAMYRIPLVSVLGGEGIGIYQMVFPLYSLLLTLSSSAIPASLAKVISESLACGRGEDAVAVYRLARKFILAVSLFCGAVLFIFGDEVAFLQGASTGGLSYVAIAPAIFLVGIVACFRGKFQGMNNMVPTALSQICEQVGKLVFSIALPLYFGSTLAEKVALAIFGVTASEGCGLLFLACYSRWWKKRINPQNLLAFEWHTGELALDSKRENFKVSKIKSAHNRNVEVLSPLFKIALPMTVSLSVYPLAGILESGLIINSLNAAGKAGVAQFGIYSGVVVTMLSLPLGVCSSLGTALIPSISSDVAKGDILLARRKISFAIKAGMAVSIAVSAMFLFFSHHIVAILFSKIAGEMGGLCERMLKWSFVNCLLSCFSNITSSILYALSLPKAPLKSQLWGLLVRFAVLFLAISRLGIYASLAGMFLGGTVSGILNFRWVNKSLESPLSARPLLSGGFCGIFLCFCLVWLAGKFEMSIIPIAILAIIYLAFLFLLFYMKFFTKEEVESFFVGKEERG